MYSLTWTEKDFPCSAIDDADCCTQHKLVFDNYLNAAVKFLELFLDADSLGSFSGRICRVRLYKSGEGNLGKKVRRDKEAIFAYLTSKASVKLTDVNEEAIQRLLWRLDPDRPREVIQTPYYTWYR
jgi:hypothetical protein